MMMTGVSAGGYLTLMYMLMEESEIPTTVGSGTNCSATWPNSFLSLAWGNVCSIPAFMREDFWLEGENRLPPMKGYMPMNSGVLFNDFLNEDAFLVNSSPKLNLLHGTCDEIIFQGYGKIPYKCIRTNASPNVYGYTSTTGTDTAKYNYSYGSAWVYSAVKNFVSTRYDQVCGGGHKPHCSTISRPFTTPQSGEADVYGGTWNVCNKDNPTSSIGTTHKLKEWIEDFADEVFTNSFTPGIASLIPELASQGCSTDVTNLSNITNITVTGTGGGGFTATTVGGLGAAEYEWGFQGCYSNGSGTGGQSGTSTLNTITIPAFAASICKLTVTVTAKNGCGGNKTYTKVTNYSGSCNNCSASSKIVSPLNEDMTETVLLLDRQLEINVKNEKIAVLNLYSLDGVLLKEDDFQLLNGTNRLDIDKLYQPSIPLTGIYLLQVVGEGISSSFRIFIQR